MSRVIEKLCALLWTVRSNLAHGSKVDLLGKLERNLEVCDVIFHVLLNLIDAILEFSSHNFPLGSYTGITSNKKIYGFTDRDIIKVLNEN